MEWLLFGKLVLILFLVVGNAFFVGSEIALTSARRSRIKQLANTGNRSAKIVQVLHDEPERFYSVTQIGITLVSLGLGAIGIITMTQVIGPSIERLFSLVSTGPEAMAWAQTVSYIISFMIISFLHVVGGELAPKVLAFHKAETLSLAVARPINGLHKLMNPLIWVMNKASNGLLRLFGQGDLAEQGEAHFSMTGEEIRTILSASEQEGALEPQLTMMLRGVFDLDDHTARDAMIPRTEVEALELIRAFTDAHPRPGFREHPGVPARRRHQGHHEDQGQENGDPNEYQGGSLVFFLNGGGGHGNGHAADEQDYRIDGTHGHIQFLGSKCKCPGVIVTIHRVGDKQSPEKQQLCKYKEPHAQLGTKIIPMFVMYRSCRGHRNRISRI